MTTELRTTIAPSDLIAVEIECAKCHQRVSRPADQWIQDILNCPNCGANWLAHRAEVERIRDAVAQIWVLSHLEANLPFSVRFEVKRDTGGAA